MRVCVYVCFVYVCRLLLLSVTETVEFFKCGNRNSPGVASRKQFTGRIEGFFSNTARLYGVLKRLSLLDDKLFGNNGCYISIT